MTGCFWRKSAGGVFFRTASSLGLQRQLRALQSPSPTHYPTSKIISAEALLVIMSSSREGVNPLRPYYVPPQIGLSPGPATSNASATPNAASASTKAFGSSARDLLSDLDYSDYLESSPSVADGVREILDRAVWKYTSVLMAQPFDVAKTILQVYVVPDAEDGQKPLDERRRQSQGYREQYFDEVC